MATAKAKKLKYSKEMYLEWYRLMLGIRRFEEKTLQMYGQQKIRGFCHVYIGQEAIAAGLSSATRDTDPLTTGYRQHGMGLLRGLSMKECMAELFGKATGCVKGKGGSMHFFNKEKQYYGGNGIVGAQIGIGTGLGFAEQYRGTDNASIAMFGDGAARQGILHECFNMAMTWKLPVLYICENNKYAMGTSVERTSNVTELHKLGLSYEMPSEAVNAMDPEEVHEALTRAMKHIRSGKGPYYLEMKTYRYKGHSVSDPAKYRTKDELGDYKEQDPIKRIEATLLDSGLMTKEELKAIDKEIKAEVAEAVKFAEESPLPDGKVELYTDNYAEPDYPFTT